MSKLQTQMEWNRREFIKRASLIAALPVLPLGLNALSGISQTTRTSKSESCQWCDGVNVPSNATWKTSITSMNEAGEPLLMSGTIYAPDGVTPAKGIVLYVYHTDAHGYYTNNGSNDLPARLRGWMRTGADGRYEFRTIKPGAYPHHDSPAHIHATLSGSNYHEYWIDDYWFAGDSRITQQKLSTLTGRGGFSPIINLKRDAEGVWRGVRDLKLQNL